MDGLTVDGYWFTLHEETDIMLRVGEPRRFEIVDDSLSIVIVHMCKFFLRFVLRYGGKFNSC